MPGGNQLKAEVLSTSACSLCGACLDWCPYLKNMEDHLVLRFDCPVNDGRCYSICPRTMTDWEAVRDQCLPGPTAELEIGGCQAIYRARSINDIPGAQDGGVVSSLLLAALHDQWVDGLVLTGSSDGLIPEPLLANEKDQLMKTAGSRFLASPGLRKLIEAQSQGWQKVAMVGRPCQIQALRKLQMSQISQSVPEVVSIGLFCMWSLSWSFLEYLHDKFPGTDFKRMSIPQHGVEVTDGKQTLAIPLEEVRQHIRPGCAYCLDMTSELADISVGAFEAESGWNTLIVRSERGAELLAKAGDILKLEEYPRSELERLKQASLNKKARNLALLSQDVAAGRLPGFIDLAAPIYKEIAARAEGMVNC